MLYSHDYLGGAKYFDVIRKGHPKGHGAGGFAVEFGDFMPVAKWLSSSGAAPAIRIQEQWAGSSHKYTKNHLEKALRLAQAYNKITGKAQILLSPFCEHRLDDPDPWLSKVQDAAPTCTIVNNPQEGMGAFSKRFMNEIHTGPPPKWGQFNWSYDGQSAADKDTEADKQRYAQAFMFFWWIWQYNCHFNKEDKTRLTKPSPELIAALTNLEGIRGDSWTKNKTLWKSFAEQSDPKGDWRSNKPMCITPHKVDSLKLVRKGKVIATLPRYEKPYVDGRQRYYLGKWGYKTATEILDVVADKEVIAKVNPGFRWPRKD